MMSIKNAKSLKQTVKAFGGGRKCYQCNESNFLMFCNRCLKDACANHMTLIYRECNDCAGASPVGTYNGTPSYGQYGCEVGYD